MYCCALSSFRMGKVKPAKGRPKPAKGRPKRNRQPPARLRSPLVSDDEEAQPTLQPMPATTQPMPAPVPAPSGDHQGSEVLNQLTQLTGTISQMMHQQQEMMNQQQQMFLAAIASLKQASQPIQPSPGPSSTEPCSSEPQPSTSSAQPTAAQPAPSTAQAETSNSSHTLSPQSQAQSSGESTPMLLPFNPTVRATPRPVRMAGTLIGAHVPLQLKQKIWAGKYVDLVELLYPNHTPAYALSISDATSGTPQLSLLPKKKQQLSQTEWSAAMDIFVSIYIEGHPSEYAEILTYVKSVKELMHDRADWAYYDFHYRTDREFTLEKWTTCNPALDAKARYRGPQTNSKAQYGKRKNPNDPQPFRGQANSKSSRIPFGYCFKYHTREVRCDNSPCQYSHECYNCRKQHPAYQKCQTTKRHDSHSKRDDQQSSKSRRSPDRKSDQR